MNPKPNNENSDSGTAKKSTSMSEFDESAVLHELKHYLPSQTPLKDFVHHNTLHAFQDLRFFDALNRASGLFGYRVSFSLREFRSLYDSKRIHDDILNRIIEQRKGLHAVKEWREKLIARHYYPSRCPNRPTSRQLKRHYKLI